MNLRLWCLIAKIQLETHDRSEVGLLRFREKHPPWGVAHHRGQVLQPWNVVWLVFVSWLNSYVNEWEDHPNHWGTTHSSIFWQWLGSVLAPLDVSFSLQTGDQGLVEFDLSSWTHLILISLCYALVLCHSFKTCALPPSLLFHALFLSSIQAHNLWRDNQKIAGPWEENTV